MTNTFWLMENWQLKYTLYIMGATLWSALTAMHKKQGCAFFFLPTPVTWTNPTNFSSAGKNNSRCKLCLKAAILFNKLVITNEKMSKNQFSKLQILNISWNGRKDSAHLMSIEQVVYTFGFCLLDLLFGGRDCCQTEIRLVAMPRNYIERGNFQ